MKTVLLIAGVLMVGIALGIVFSAVTIRRLRKRVRELRAGTARANLFRSVTKFLFVTTQIFSLIWVSASYGIAIYSTVRLYQPFPVTELSQQAIITLLGASALKVLENIFEHNDGMVFGRSKTGETPADAPEDPPGMG